MSQETVDQQAGPSAETLETKKLKVLPPDSVILVAYPKVMMLYPTFLAALVAALGMTFLGQDAFEGAARTPVTLTSVFLLVLTVNLMVLTIDFPRATILTTFFVGSTAVLMFVLLQIWKPEFFPWVRGLAGGVQPIANATFFWVISIVLGLVFAIAKIAVQFDYWEVRRNEILHHHGFLSDLRRYPTAGLQVEKEINDVFEFVLLRSGRLILRPQGESRAFVLDNVPFIDSKETKLTQLLSSMKVKVQSDQ